MTTILSRPAIRDAVLPISVEQYHQLGAAGIIDENTELLGGVIVRKTIKSPKHSWFVQKLAAIISPQIGSSYLLRQEQPLSLTDSEPEPDLAVVSGTIDDYRSLHPTTAKLVIEIAITGEELDREKAPLYAAAGIEEYWLILVPRQSVERYTVPRSGGYSQQQILDFHATLKCDSLPAVQVDLSQFA